ncbi:MAG: thiamine phosphate synthase [Hyphomicrobiales bacterium]|nr:thiamine phosphate synthase [Hyphomicrobiales bacterium]
MAPPLLYLRIAAPTAPEQLAEALAGGLVACVLLEASYLAASDDDARGLIVVAAEHGVPTLVEAGAETAERLSAGGVHLPHSLSNKATIAGARARLGDAAAIGAEAGVSRHLAMELGEAGADYVSLGGGGRHDVGQIENIVRWWSELIETPCVAWHSGGHAEASRLAAAGADFLAVGDLVWDADCSPREAIERLHRGGATGAR